MLNRTLLLILAASVSLAAGQASADPEVGPQTVTLKVAYADLDLATDAGAREALRRLDRAASIACGRRPAFGPLMLEQVEAWDACRARAVATSVQAMGQPTVSRLYAGGQTRLASASR
jgi:UrcA family protein